MQVLYDKAPGPTGSVLTLGTFDGFHRGHQALLQAVASRAASLHTFVEVWIYHPHPRTVLRGEIVPLLTTLSERLHLLQSFGVSVVRVISFSQDLAQVEAAQFITDWIGSLSAPKALVLGYDHHFGCNREGNAHLLRIAGFFVEEVAPFLEGGIPISSSRIRQLVSQGQVDQARLLLGRPYFVEGQVQKGQHIAHRLGTPTANLPWPLEKIQPPAGVYVGRTTLPHSPNQLFPALLYLSPMGVLEVHVLNQAPLHLYGQPLRVYMEQFIRPHEEGLSQEDLQKKIQTDLQAAQTYWASQDYSSI
jgi:riboflavin kinase/FMN adenylyltransferase